MRGDAYFADPEFKDDARVKAFAQKFKARTGSYPIYPVSHVVQALIAVTDSYAAAMKASGQWPSTEQVADALRKLEFRGLSRPIRMRPDGQALQGQLFGITKTMAGLPFAAIDKLTYVPPELVTTPVGQKSPEWVKTLKPELIRSDRIKEVGAAVIPR